MVMTPLAVFKAVLVLIGFWLAYFLRDIIMVVLVSVVLASAVEPATRFFSKYRIPRVIAVLSVYLLFFVLVIGLFPYFIFPIIKEVITIVTSMPAKIGSISSIIGSPDSFLSILDGIPFDQIYTNVQHSFASISRGFFETASYFFGGFFSFALIIVISFYLAVQEDGVGEFLKIVTPLRFENYTLDLWKRARRKIGLWIQGQLLLGLLVGIIVYLGLQILGIPYALVLSILAAVFELIPVFGPILSSVPAILLGFSIGPATGLMAFGLYVIIQQFENNLLYPLVVKKIVGVPSLVVILALIVGAKLFGFLGMLLSVPVAAVLMELVSDWESHKRSQPSANG